MSLALRIAGALLVLSAVACSSSNDPSAEHIASASELTSAAPSERLGAGQAIELPAEDPHPAFALFLKGIEERAAPFKQLQKDREGFEAKHGTAAIKKLHQQFRTEMMPAEPEEMAANSMLNDAIRYFGCHWSESKEYLEWWQKKIGGHAPKAGSASETSLDMD